MAMPAHDGKRQPMVPRGRFMTKTDTSCWNGQPPSRLFCSVPSPQHSVLIFPDTRHLTP